MLSSITPLGERGRNQRYGLTAASFVVGSTAGGLALGAACGSLGRLLAGVDGLLAVVAGLAAVAALLVDGARRPVPSTKRQVNEDWLARWRGWVYGGGFGLQLGVGLATVVPAALGYLVWILATATASTRSGAAVGALFGLVRGATLLTAKGVRSQAELITFHRRLDRWAVRAHVAALGADALAVGLVGAQLLR